MTGKKRLGLVAFVVLASVLLLAPVAGAQGTGPNQATGAWAVYNPGFAITASLNAVAMGAANDVWAVGDGGSIYHYNGTNWSPVASGVSLDLNSVSPVPGQPGVAWVVGSGQGGGNPSTVLVCHSATASCTRDMTVPTTGQLDGVWALSATDVWAVGGGSTTGIVLHYLNGAWQQFANVPQRQYHNIQMVSSTEGWAVGEPIAPGMNGIVIHYVNGAWTDVTASIPFAYNSPLISLWFISSGEGWLVGGNPNTPNSAPAIVHYLNGNWNAETAPNAGTLFWYVNMLPTRTGFSVGNGGQIFERNATTGQWSQAFIMPANPQPLYGVWVLPDGSQGWAVGGNTPNTGPGVGVLIHYAALVRGPFKAYMPFIGK